MRLTTGHPPREAVRGFTLIELLLATVLTLMLVGAAVFSFSTLSRGAALSEGARQLEALIRYARAHAANTGRQVMISFEDGGDPDFPWIPANVSVTWEPDPVGQPGAFQRLKTAEPYVEELNRLVQVEDVRVSDPESATPARPDAVVASGEDSSLADDPAALPSIRIYPDGSSDSAEIVLCSRTDDDSRRLGVSLLGLTGTIRQHSVLESPVPGEDEEMESNLADPANPATSGSSPTSKGPLLPVPPTPNETRTTTGAAGQTGHASAEDSAATPAGR
jgi:type II secretory pathway pseudopilin PulG